MKLFHVTITGADQSLSDIQELFKLSEEFRFVEWGILYSSSQGKLRYPPKQWQDELFAMCDNVLETHGWAPNLSAHLCGKYALDALFKNLFMLPSKHFKRCQINTSCKNLHKTDIFALDKSLYMFDSGVEFIFQYRSKSDDLKIQDMAKCNEMCSAMTHRFAALYDISGGNGILPTSWPKPFENVRTGYAGGLNPDNLEEQLAKIALVVGDNSVSIDMESGVRTNNLFDLDKVRRCLQIASIYK